MVAAAVTPWPERVSTFPMRIPILIIDAFAAGPFQGNPAAICPLQEWLPDDLLQAIATQNNLSETAFYVPGAGDADFALRWFTPASEVDLCGHATLAAAAALLETGGDEGDSVTFSSRSGLLSVRRSDGLLTLDFPALSTTDCDAPAALVEGLGANPSTCGTSDDWLAVFSSEQEIRDLDPDFRRLADLDLRGVIATAPGEDCDFVSRFFAPKFGIDEDPVTGSAHCILTPWWADRLGKETLVARQLSERGGSLRCELVGDRVRIGGGTRIYLEGTIDLG